jgi:hypothetical protein
MPTLVLLHHHPRTSLPDNIFLQKTADWAKLQLRWQRKQTLDLLETRQHLDHQSLEP